MNRTRPLAVLVLVTLVVVGAVAPTLVGPQLGGSEGVAAAGHGDADKGNFTVVPSRQPGLDDGDMKSFAVPNRGFEKLDFLRATWKEGGFSGCGASNGKAFGVDRNNDDPGTETDESFTKNVKSTKVTEDVFEADFYDEDDFGGSPPTLNAGDQFVNHVTGCIDTPDDPGWYQLQSTTAGQDGEIQASSHYFYVCDCSNEQEAREQLGPPPSEDTPTPTATAESTPTATETAESTPTPEPTPTRTPPEDGTPFPSPTPTATPSATPDATASAAEASDSDTASGDTGDGASEDGASDGEASDGGGDAAGGNDTGGTSGEDGADGAAAGTATPSPEDWSDVVQKSPTAAEGPGFGAVTALVAALVGALLVARRRR